MSVVAAHRSCVCEGTEREMRPERRIASASGGEAAHIVGRTRENCALQVGTEGRAGKWRSRQRYSKLNVFAVLSLVYCNV